MKRFGIRKFRSGGVPSLPVTRPMLLRGAPTEASSVDSFSLFTSTLDNQGTTSSAYAMSYQTAFFDADAFGLDPFMRYGIFRRSVNCMIQNASNVPGIIVHRWLFTLKNTVRMNETDQTFYDIIANVETQAGYSSGEWLKRGASPLSVAGIHNVFKIKQLKSININPGKMYNLVKFKAKTKRVIKTWLTQLSSTGDLTTAGRKFNWRKGYTWLVTKVESPMIKGDGGNNGPAPAKVQDYVYVSKRILHYTSLVSHTDAGTLSAQTGTGKVYATTGALVADLNTF